MTDLQETPATPEEDHGGDERFGLLIAGGVLVLVGWGGAVIANLLVHLLAPVGGRLLVGSLRVFPAMGPFAWATFAVGVFTGAVGIGLLLLARSSPKGPFALPGVSS